MKEIYQEVEMEVIHFDVVDIIATSSPLDDPLDPDELPAVTVPQN